MTQLALTLEPEPVGAFQAPTLTAERCLCSAAPHRKVWQVMLVVPKDYGHGPPRTGWRRERTVCCYGCARARVRSLGTAGVYAEIAPLGEPRVGKRWRTYRERNARRSL